METVKSVIMETIQYIKKGVSFVELEMELDKHGVDYRGDSAMMNSNDKNVVYWAGWNNEAFSALEELVMDDKVEMMGSSIHVYMVDGKCMKFPVVKSRTHKYKKIHWQPVEFNLIEGIKVYAEKNV